MAEPNPETHLDTALSSLAELREYANQFVGEDYTVPSEAVITLDLILTAQRSSVRPKLQQIQQAQQ